MASSRGDGAEEGQTWHQSSNKSSHKRQRRQSPSDSTQWRARAYDRDQEHYASYEANAYGHHDQGEEHDTSPPSGKQMRLVKLSSDILPDNQQVAIIDAGAEGTSIGRDKSFTPRIRLPVMEISKHHSNLFLMRDPTPPHADSFYVSDMGSTYGTFILPGAGLQTHDVSRLPPTSHFRRLSEAKKSSSPYRLSHGDVLRVGHTTFVVHVHEWPGSCQGCKLREDGANEIPLHSGGGAAATTSRTQSSGGPSTSTSTPGAEASTAGATAYAQVRGTGDRKLDAAAQRKRQMAELKSSYLSAPSGDHHHQQPAPRSKSATAAATSSSSAATGGGGGGGQYQDRAAQRRARHPNEPAPLAQHPHHQHQPRHVEGPGPSGPRSRSSPYPRPTHPATAATSSTSRIGPPSPPRALTSDNRGYQLFAQMTSGGASSPHGDGSSHNQQAPVEARATSGRAGLGSRPLLQAHEVGHGLDRGGGGGGGGATTNIYTDKEGREEARRRRYEEAVRRGG